MKVAKPTVFWASTLAISLIALVLLRPILLPFVVGMTLAYLLVPVVDRLEARGINRSLAALALVLVLVAGFVGLVLVMLPALVGELRFFIGEFPRSILRIQVPHDRVDPTMAAQASGRGDPDRNLRHTRGCGHGRGLAR